MIKDIPTSDDFSSAAKAQFDFAWDIVISYILNLDEAEKYAEIGDEEKSAYWEAARQRVLTSLIIAQQGVELAIKGRLASLSPYLLIGGHPAEWPKDVDGTGISFSEFKTIDAQDLIKAHNTVSSVKFDNDFSSLFEKLRKLRNRAMHTVDRQVIVSAEEVIILLLEFHEYLYPNDNWVTTRRKFLNNAPASHVYFGDDPTDGSLAKEFITVFNLLTPAQIKKFFKINVKQRLYICPACKHEIEEYETADPDPEYAVLRPNKPDSETLYCFVCNSLHPVVRKDCIAEDCPGNVISYDYDYCCTCGSRQSD